MRVKMAAPSALIASCASHFDPQEIVKCILNVPTLPDGNPVVESIVSYDWHIDTKYYTADIHLCTTDQRTIGDESFADSVEAFIVYFDTHEKSSFQKVSSWLPYLTHINPAVQILVCQTSRQEDTVSRQTALEWCIDNGFELVEMEPEENSDDDEDNDFVETTGPKRIVQALHAHTWPNLTLKDKPPVCSTYFRNLMQEEAALRSSAGSQNEEDGSSCTDSTPENAKVTASTASTVGSPPVEGAEVSEDKAGDQGEKEEKSEGIFPDDNELAMLAAIGNEDPDEESFEQLLGKLKLMKEKAATLPPEERKSYAEQVAVTFWRAIGGEEEEIDGLFDDEDDDNRPTI